MNKLTIPFICVLCSSLTLIYGCKKEVFDYTITEVAFPTSDEIDAVDCPEFMLNIGDVCAVFDQEGMVSVNCDCLDPNTVDVVEIEFINDIGAAVVVTVETTPSFLAGKTYVEVPVEGMTLPYYLPLGTESLSVEAFFACADLGVASQSADSTIAPSVDGMLVELHVDCP
ncbi:MAG: hypothetical protein ACO3MV_03995 [Flavobacteriales bacterium]